MDGRVRAYYNEHDPLAAAWLRELIRQGLIADGVVDERSIVDVRGGDLAGYTQCHFFAGIGGWSYALRLAGWPDDRAVWTGSCPCQPFSAAGQQKGFDDHRHLWPVFGRLIAECRPAVVFGEQVASKAGRNWLAVVRGDLEGQGYAVGAADLAAASVGAPHIRQRHFWGGWLAESGCELPGRGLRGSREGDRAARGGASGELGGPGGVDAGGIVADADGGIPSDGVVQRSGRHVQLQEDAVVGGGDARGDRGRTLADDDPPGRGILAQPRLRRAGVYDADRRGACGGAAAGREGMADPARGGLAGSRGSGEAQGLGTPERGVSGVAATTPVDWTHADWLPCRDGKVRPVEPGTFPLAHGLPARVGRLRGYGNAIVPHVAAGFIASFVDAIADVADAASGRRDPVSGGSSGGVGERVAAAVPVAAAGWPTPVANDDNKTPEAHLAMKLRMGERDGTGSQRTAITSLQVMAQLVV